MAFRYPKTLFFLLILAGILAKPAPANAQNGISVMELFTTQGCSSCPPADRIIEQIVAENAPNTIALSCHVTYFDKTDWQDRLARPFCDARHSEYFKALDLEAMFTPQVIVNGKFDIKGNSGEGVRSAISMGHSLNSIQPIQLALREGYLDITLPRMRLDKPADIWLMSYKSSNKNIISAGQNKGEVLNYVNVVQYMTKLLIWNGSYVNMAFPIEFMPGDGYVVLAQKADQTEILAAGKTGP